MAQNVWINLMLDGSSAGKHTSIGGANGSGDVTFSYDKAKLTTLSSTWSWRKFVAARWPLVSNEEIKAMASHYVALNRGQDGSNQADFLTGVAPSADVFEFRVDDASGARPTDILLALKSFIRFFEDRTLSSGAGFVING